MRYARSASTWYARPITSDRPEHVTRLLAEGATVDELLATGEVTLAAIAAACYGGDLERAKVALYGPPSQPTT